MRAIAKDVERVVLVVLLMHGRRVGRQDLSRMRPMALSLQWSVARAHTLPLRALPELRNVSYTTSFMSSSIRLRRFFPHISWALRGSPEQVPPKIPESILPTTDKKTEIQAPTLGHKQGPRDKSTSNFAIADCSQPPTFEDNTPLTN